MQPMRMDGNFLAPWVYLHIRNFAHMVASPLLSVQVFTITKSGWEKTGNSGPLGKKLFGISVIYFCIYIAKREVDYGILVRGLDYS